MPEADVDHAFLKSELFETIETAAGCSSNSTDSHRFSSGGMPAANLSNVPITYSEFVTGGPMADFEAVKAAIDKQLYVWELFKTTNDERLTAMQRGQDTKARELDEKLGRIESD